MVIDNSRQEEIESDSRATFPYAVVFEFETTMYVTNIDHDTLESCVISVNGVRIVLWNAQCRIQSTYAF